MNKIKAFCFIVVVLGFTFFPGLAESKGAQGLIGSHFAIAHVGDLQEFAN